MKDNAVKFAELLSKDEGIRKELEAACAGISKDDKKALAEATAKAAAKHGFTFTAEELMSSESEELSEDEMKAVAGGKCSNDLFLFFCGGTNFACATSSYLG